MVERRSAPHLTSQGLDLSSCGLDQTVSPSFEVFHEFYFLFSGNKCKVWVGETSLDDDLEAEHELGLLPAEGGEGGGGEGEPPGQAGGQLLLTPRELSSHGGPRAAREGVRWNQEEQRIWCLFSFCNSSSSDGRATMKGGKRKHRFVTKV